jgi:hypothetical protein
MEAGKLDQAIAFQVNTRLPRDTPPSSLQNIRLSSAAANLLSRSHNRRADGDGYVGLHLMQVPRRALGCDGLHGWKRAW